MDNPPEMIVHVNATLTPEQLSAYEAIFNNATEHHRSRFLPPEETGEAGDD